MVYAPTGVTDIDEVMTLVAQRNGYDVQVAFDGDTSSVGAPPQCGAAGASEFDKTRRCLLGFASVPAMTAWLSANQGRAGVGIVFGDTTETENADGTTTIAQARVPLPPLWD